MPTQKDAALFGPSPGRSTQHRHLPMHQPLSPTRQTRQPIFRVSSVPSPSRPPRPGDANANFSLCLVLGGRGLGARRRQAAWQSICWPSRGPAGPCRLCLAPPPGLANEIASPAARCHQPPPILPQTHSSCVRDPHPFAADRDAATRQTFKSLRDDAPRRPRGLVQISACGAVRRDAPEREKWPQLGVALGHVGPRPAPPFRTPCFEYAMKMAGRRAVPNGSNSAEAEAAEPPGRQWQAVASPAVRLLLNNPGGVFKGTKSRKI